MNAALVALLVSLGGGTWIYTKFQRRTGSANSQSAAIGAAVSAIIIFVVVFTVAEMI